MRIYFLLFCLAAFSVGVFGQEAPEELTTDAIIEMVQAGLSDRLIIQKIRISTFLYEPSVQDIVQLRKAGASNRIIQAVMGVPMTSETRYRTEDRGTHPKIELFGGYSRLGTEGGVGLNGLNIAFSYNPIDWLGLVVDSSSHYNNIGTDASIHSLHFGPQFAFRFNRVTPFVRPLVGFSHIREDFFGIPIVRETGFSFGFGGGLDVKVANHVAIRAVQFDYVNIRVGGFGSDNARLSFGVVGRW